MINAVAISRDNSRIVSGSNDRTVKVWDVTTGNCLKTLEGHSDNVISVAISDDGSRVISGSHDKTVRLWNLLEKKDCEEYTEFDIKLKFSSIAVAPDFKQVFVGLENGKIVKDRILIKALLY